MWGFITVMNDILVNIFHRSSLLVMAIVGGAILPRIQSEIIESYSIQASFIGLNR